MSSSSGWPAASPSSPLSCVLSLANSTDGERWADLRLVDASGKAHNAHRIIVASQSRFLDEILRAHEELDDVVIVLADMPTQVLEAALAFIYKGKVDMPGLQEAQSVLGLEGQATSEPLVTALASARPKRKRLRNRRMDLDSFQLSEPKFGGPTEVDEDLICCGVEFKTKAELEAHGQSYECELTLADKIVLKRKRSSTTKVTRGNKENLICCDTEFENEVVYTSHKVVGHQEKPEGDKYLICCDEKLTGNLKVHLQSSHKLDDATEMSKCCDNTFDGLLDLTRHCATTHGLRLSQYKRMICCATTLSNFDEWNQHKQQDSSHVECSYCAFISKDERHLSMHLYTKHKVGSAKAGKEALVCKHCGQSFKTYTETQEHEDKHNNDYKYSCGSCSKEFKLLSSLKTHIYRLGKHHNPEAKEYRCDLCEKVFATISERRKHLRAEHQKKENFNCNDCDQSFVDKHRLATHTKVRHLKVKDIQCSYCGKLFATQERMRIHEKFVHVVENEKVPCDLCDKQFSNKDRMIDHRRSVHRDRKYQCESCGSTFKNSSTLKSHVVSIHLSHDKKPLRCGTCGKGFLHDSRLKAHEIIHNDEAPYSCKFCGRPNKCKNNNLKHEKRCKKGVADQPASNVLPVETTYVPVALVANESVQHGEKSDAAQAAPLAMENN